MKNFPSIPTDKIIDDAINNLKDDQVQNVNNDNCLETDILQNNNEIFIDINKSNSNSSKYDEIFNEKNSQNSSSKDVRIQNKSSLSKTELQNDKFISKQNSQNFQKEDYLNPIDWLYTNDSNILYIESNIEKLNEQINLQEYSQLCNSIKKCDLNYVFKNPNLTFCIGPISTVENLVESNFVFDQTYKEDMIAHILLLDNYVYRWRNINGDGNCFYRAIIFSLFENIVVTNDIMLLKEIIILFNDKINVNNKYVSNNPYIKKYIEKMDKNLIIQILCVLFNTMDNEEKNLYEILIKIFNFCSFFDKGMIFFMRFLIYEYILENENKVYSSDFGLKIGNLLPDKFITEKNEFLYDQFFEKELLKMEEDAEKIVIYLTPFIFRIDLNIIMYNFERGETVCERLFKCGLKNKQKINVLFRVTHYDILYDEKYFNQYKKFFDIYTKKKIILKVININELNQLRNINSTSSIDNINKNKNDVVYIQEFDNNQKNDESICISCYKKLTKTNKLNLCLKCLRNEIDNQMFSIYINYLNKITNYKTESIIQINPIFTKYFNKLSCNINNKSYNLLEIISLSGNSLNDFIKIIKKRICVMCQNNINSSSDSYNLPCGCILCSTKCIQKYLEFLLVNEYQKLEILKIKKSIFEVCFCGYQFNFNDYIKLYKTLMINKFKSFQKKFKKVIGNNWVQKCLICFINYLPQHTFYKLELKDDELNNIFDIKKFNHIICKNCFDKSLKEINCLICCRMHKISSYTKKDNDDDDGCSIY